MSRCLAFEIVSTFTRRDKLIMSEKYNRICTSLDRSCYRLDWSCVQAEPATRVESPAAGNLWARDNLFAWCVPPFDARSGRRRDARRCSEAGFKTFGYDWREEHIPTVPMRRSRRSKEQYQLIVLGAVYADDPKATVNWKDQIIADPHDPIGARDRRLKGLSVGLPLETMLETFKRRMFNPTWVSQPAKHMDTGVPNPWSLDELRKCHRSG